MIYFYNAIHIHYAESVPEKIDDSCRFGPVTDEWAGAVLTGKRWGEKIVSVADKSAFVMNVGLVLICLWDFRVIWASLVCSSLMKIITRLLASRVADQDRASNANNVRQLLDGPTARRISLWSHTSALIGGWEADISSNESLEGEFMNPLNLIAAVDAIERHIGLFAPASPGLSRLAFRVNIEFCEAWCAQTPEDIATLRPPIMPELDREIRAMLDRVRQEAASGQRVFDVAVGFVGKP